jgi:hypothetical protein
MKILRFSVSNMKLCILVFNRHSPQPRNLSTQRCEDLPYLTCVGDSDYFYIPQAPGRDRSNIGSEPFSI